jgi:hypothetical protein
MSLILLIDCLIDGKNVNIGYGLWLQELKQSNVRIKMNHILFFTRDLLVRFVAVCSMYVIYASTYNISQMIKFTIFDQLKLLGQLVI